LILDVRNYYQLYKISQLINLGDFKDIDFTAQTFFQYLIDNFDRDKIKVFVNVENKEINGFVICSLSQDVVTQRPEVFIDLVWVKKGIDGNIGDDLLKKVEDYTKSLKLSRISGFTLRGEEGAMFRKYGFRPYSTIMVKDLTEAPQNAEKGAEMGLQDTKSYFEASKSHKDVCKRYYEKHKKTLRQKRRKRYRMNKSKESLNNNMNKGGKDAEQGKDSPKA